MNAAIQPIWDKVQTYLRDKVNPAADPAKVLAKDEAELFENILTVMEAIYPDVPPMPEGFEWVTAPSAPTFGVGTITETSASIINDGVNYTVPGATLSEPYAATDMHRLDYVAVNLDTITDPEILGPTYVIIQGVEVAETATFAAPTLPVNHAFVRSVIVTDSGAINAPVDTPVKVISVNGEAEQTPDAAGKVNLVVDANTIPYTPADLIWWEPVIDGTTVILKEGLDYLQTQVKDNKSAADLRETLQTLTDAATVSWNMNSGHVATVTLAGNRTLAISNTARYGTLIVKQDTTGSRTLALPAGSKVINNGAGTAALSTAANSIDVLTFLYDGTNYYWNIGPKYN